MIPFLDFDGVLHPDEAYLVHGRPVLQAEGELFMWAPLLTDVLADRPKVRIALSTSWARDLRFIHARDWPQPASPPEYAQRGLILWKHCTTLRPIRQK